jgi:predicted nucleic-acid-binding Zn-ribbon protein
MTATLRFVDRSRLEAALTASINQRVDGKECLRCGQDQFVAVIGDEVGLESSRLLAEAESNSAGQPKSFSPVTVPVVCTNCGHTEHFSLQVLLRSIPAGEI